MARVTIEGCLALIPNHFDVCLAASKRARQLARGADARLPWGDHKSTVLSLKEIESGLVDMTVLEEADLPSVKPAEIEISLPEFDPNH